MHLLPAMLVASSLVAASTTSDLRYAGAAAAWHAAGEPVAAAVGAPPAPPSGARWNAPALDYLPASDLVDLGGTSWSVHVTTGPGAGNCSGKTKVDPHATHDLRQNL